MNSNIANSTRLTDVKRCWPNLYRTISSVSCVHKRYNGILFCWLKILLIQTFNMLENVLKLNVQIDEKKIKPNRSSKLNDFLIFPMKNRRWYILFQELSNRSNQFPLLNYISCIKWKLFKWCDGFNDIIRKRKFICFVNFSRANSDNVIY